MPKASSTCSRSAAGALALLCALLALAGPATAHQASLSYGTYALRGAQVRGEIRFALADLDAAVPALAAPRPDRGTPGAELLQATTAVVLQTLALRSEQGPCPASAPRGELDGRDGLLIQVTFSCPGPIQRLELRFPLLSQLPPGHAHLVKLIDEDRQPPQVAERVLTLGDEQFAFVRGSSPAASFLRFLKLGVAHIFQGIDHLCFLLGLLLLGGRLRQLVGIVTSFTVAHSITLALAALEIVTPSPRLIEPLIALSIAFVAAENLWVLRRGPEQVAHALRHRWMLTFAFGLVHGFGFAAALRELQLPRASLAAGLVSFNLGVEAGQICIVALMLPVLALLRTRTRWFARFGAEGVSLAVGVAGLAWFVQRLVSPG